LLGLALTMKRSRTITDFKDQQRLSNLIAQVELRIMSTQFGVTQQMILQQTFCALICKRTIIRTHLRQFPHPCQSPHQLPQQNSFYSTGRALSV
jgi:hypothetical protein